MKKLNICIVFLLLIIAFSLSACESSVAPPELPPELPIELPIEPAPPPEPPPIVWRGTGTEDDPFLISSAEELQAVEVVIGREIPESFPHYKLTCDLTVTDFKPIGGNDYTIDDKGYTNNVSGSFRGVFDGDGHTITIESLVVESKFDHVVVGLFGSVGGTIKNLGVVGNLESHAPKAIIGLIAAYSTGKIINCYTAGQITAYGEESEVGGIIGKGGSIYNSYSSVFIANHGFYSSSGGLCGESWGPMENSYSLGSLLGRNEVGGLIGYGNYGAMNSASLCSILMSDNEFYVGRIIGTHFPGYSDGQGYSRRLMKNNLAIPIYNIKERDNAKDRNGKSISIATAKKRSTYEKTLGFAFGETEDAPWKWGGDEYPLPILYWQNVEDLLPFPSHLR